MCKYRDELISCSCGHEYIYGFDEVNHYDKCPYCKKKRREFCYLQVGKSKVLLEPGKELYRFHLDKYSSEYNCVDGKVIQNKNNPNLWGIKLNLTEPILIKDKDGNEKTIQGQGVIPIVAGLKIKFSDNQIGIINHEK